MNGLYDEKIFFRCTKVDFLHGLIAGLFYVVDNFDEWPLWFFGIVCNHNGKSALDNSTSVPVG